MHVGELASLIGERDVRCIVHRVSMFRVWTALSEDVEVSYGDAEDASLTPQNSGVHIHWQGTWYKIEREARPRDWRQTADSGGAYTKPSYSHTPSLLASGECAC
jgi:hypothetical protein